MDRRKPPLVPIVLLIVLPVLWGLAYWFVCDDAFISFRYARNLLRGDGLVYNPGEYVEGYTNFLWVLELAALWKVGLRPEWAAPLLGVFWTLVTGAAIAALAARTPLTSPWSRWAAPLALLLWSSNRSVAVWVTSGLETRQFTALVTAGLYAASRWRDGPRWLALTSVLYALAVLTRPEALLIGPLVLLWLLGEHLRARCVTWRAVAAAALPFLVIVGAHLLWRHAYYGEWLPNTYYAKNVRPWWDAGLTYLGVVAIEHALYLLIPLAILGTRARWRHGDRLHLAMWLWAIPMYLHLARLGGDHFEFRMFDELWPVLALAGADGLLALAGASRRKLAICTALTVAFGLAIPLAHDRGAFKLATRNASFRMHVEVDLATAPWLALLPPIPFLLPTYNRWSRWLPAHFIADRAREHQLFGRFQASAYAPFEGLADEGVFVGPVVTAASTGAVGFYQPDFVVIDVKGLTDATVARNPVTRADDERQLAHDRDPPPGYLSRRGVNFELVSLRPSLRAALRDSGYAVEIADGVWMAFKSPRPGDLPGIFGARKVYTRADLPDAPR